MNITEERAAKLSAYLNEDAARAAKLAEMTAEEAAKAMTADGCEVTAEELNEIAAQVSSDELNEDALEDVAGGCGKCVKDVIITVGKILFRHRTW